MTIYRRIAKRVSAALTRPSIWVVAVLFVVGTLIHYPRELLGTESDSLLSFLGLTHQAVERMFFLIPVTYAGMLFGLRTGLSVLALSLAVIVPRIFITHEFRIEAALETGAVIILGVLVNIWFENKRRENALYRQVVQKLEESEQRMRVSEQKYHYLFENASDAIWVQDVNGLFMDGNRAFEKLTGFAREEVRGAHLRQFLNPESLELAREIRMKLIEGEDFKQPYLQQFYIKGGREKTVQMSTNAVIEGGRITGFEHVARDVTQEKEQEAAVRSYIRQTTMAQEEERKRVARDLHDDVSPEILVTINKLDALEAGRKLTPALTRQKLADIRAQAVKALESLRRTAQGLRPRIIDDLGLVAAVEWMGDELEKDQGVNVRVAAAGLDREPSPEIQIVMFRIIQEALNNVRKHARASRVDIIITGTPGAIYLKVMDNGRGFAVPSHVEDRVREGRLGLMGMGERAELVGGTFEITSAPDRGTTIRVSLPWQVAGSGG